MEDNIKEKSNVYKSIEFDVFATGLPVPINKNNKVSIVKKVLKHPLPSKTKYNEVWRRIRMKLKLKYLLSEWLIENKFSSKVNFRDQLIKINRKATGLTNYSNIENLGRCMIHPQNSLKSAWDGVVTMCLMYTAILMPLSLAFYESGTQDAWYWLDLIIDCFFFTDLVLIFNTAYYDSEGILISDRCQVTLKYLKSWFLIDLVSCIPFILITGSGGNYNSLLRLARLPRLAKLLRISRLLKVLKTGSSTSFLRKIEDRLNIKTSAMRLFQGFVTIILMLHLMACLWYFSAKFQNFDVKTWVMVCGFADMDISSLYLRSLYFTLTTLTTVGYGDIYANNDLERVLVIMWIMIVMFFMTFNISSMSNMVSSIDTKESILQYKLSVIEDFCEASNLNDDLSLRLKDSLRYSTEKSGGSLYNKQDIILQLPKKLRYQVSLVMHKGHARNINFFTENDSVFVSNLIPLLISHRFRINNDIYLERDHPDEIYFIVKGRVGFVYSDKKIIFQQVTNGMLFGNIEIFVPSPRIFGTKALIQTEVLTLKKNLLMQVLGKFPAIEREMICDSEKSKMIALRNIIEMKVIFEFKKEENSSITNQKIKEEVNKRYIQYQKIWRNDEKYDMTNDEILGVSENIKKKVRNLYDYLEIIDEKIFRISEAVKNKNGII